MVSVPSVSLTTSVVGSDKASVCVCVISNRVEGTGLGVGGPPHNFRIQEMEAEESGDEGFSQLSKDGSDANLVYIRSHMQKSAL